MDFVLTSTLTRPADLHVSDRPSSILFLFSLVWRKHCFSLKHNTLTTGWQRGPLNENVFQGALCRWTQTPEALIRFLMLMFKDSLLWRWLWVENICFSAVPRADCWNLRKSEIKSIYLHVLLFIYFEVGETEKKIHPQSLDFIEFICRWEDSVLYWREVAPWKHTSRTECAVNAAAAFCLCTTPESPFPTFVFTSAHFFQPGRPFNA